MAKKHKHHKTHIETISSPELRSLKEDIQRIKLERELKRLKEEEKPKDDSLDTPQERKTKRELEELQKKRESMKGKKGFSAFLGKAKLNYEINQSRAFLSNERKMKNLGQQVKLKTLQAEVVKKEEELRNTRKRLNEIDIFGNSFEPPKKIDLKDLI